MTTKELENNEFEKIDLIWDSSEVQVIHIKSKNTNAEYAMKVLKFSYLDEEIEKYARNEYEILSRNIKNVVRSEGFFVDRQNKLILITMKKYKSSLKAHASQLQEPPKIFTQLKKIFGDIVRGISL